MWEKKMNQQKNSVSEKGHGYFRKRNKALVSMITLFGALMVSSVAMADEVNPNPTSEIPATSQPVLLPLLVKTLLQLKLHLLQRNQQQR